MPEQSKDFVPGKNPPKSQALDSEQKERSATISDPSFSPHSRHWAEASINAHGQRSAEVTTAFFDALGRSAWIGRLN